MVSSKFRYTVQEEVINSNITKQGVLVDGASDYSSSIMILNKPGSTEKHCVVDLRYMNSRMWNTTWLFDYSSMIFRL